MSTFRILVTGSRVVSPAEADYVRRVLSMARDWAIAVHGADAVVVVQGECPEGGVDLVAARWADAADDATPEGHPADWAALGKAAGPARNSHMVNLGANLCLAFPAKGSRGTWDCVQKAVDAGIRSHLYPLHTREEGN